MSEPPNPPIIQVCPTCKQRMLMLNTAGTHYQCFNKKCRDYRTPFFKETIEKVIQVDQAAQQQLASASGRNSTPWFGNQYYDTNKKRWRDGKYKRVRIGGHPWVWYFLFFVFLSIVGALILGYFHPGSHLSIFPIP